MGPWVRLIYCKPWWPKAWTLEVHHAMPMELQPLSHFGTRWGRNFVHRNETRRNDTFTMGFMSHPTRIVRFPSQPGFPMCPSCKAKAQTLEDALSWEIKQIEKSMGEKGHLTASRDVTGGAWHRRIRIFDVIPLQCHRNVNPGWD